MCHYNGCTNCNTRNEDLKDICVLVNGKWVVLCPEMQLSENEPYEDIETCEDIQERSFQGYHILGHRAGSSLCNECQTEHDRERSRKSSKTYRERKQAEAKEAAAAAKKAPKKAQSSSTQRQLLPKITSTASKQPYGSSTIAGYPSVSYPYPVPDQNTGYLGTPAYDSRMEATTTDMGGLSMTPTTAPSYSVPGQRSRESEPSRPRPAGSGNYDRDYNLPSGQSRQNAPSLSRTTGATRRRHKTSSPEEDSSSSEHFESPQDRPHRHGREPRDPHPPSKKSKGDKSHGRGK